MCAIILTSEGKIDLYSFKITIKKTTKEESSRIPSGYAMDTRINYYRNTYADTYIVTDRKYKKDRFERFLDFLMANIMILRGLCIIAYVLCKLAEKVTAPAEPSGA